MNRKEPFTDNQDRNQRRLTFPFDKVINSKAQEGRNRIDQDSHGYPEGIMINGFFPVVVFKEKRNIKQDLQDKQYTADYDY